LNKQRTIDKLDEIEKITDAARISENQPIVVVFTDKEIKATIKNTYINA
jgi:hypothetical protein